MGVLLGCGVVVDERRSLRWGQAAQYRGGDSTATMRRSTNGASNEHGRQLFLRLDDPTRCLDSAAYATLLHAGHEEIRLGAYFFFPLPVYPYIHFSTHTPSLQPPPLYLVPATATRPSQKQRTRSHKGRRPRCLPLHHPQSPPRFDAHRSTTPTRTAPRRRCSNNAALPSPPPYSRPRRQSRRHQQTRAPLQHRTTRVQALCAMLRRVQATLARI